MSNLAAVDRACHSTYAKVEKWDEDQTAWVSRRTGLVEPKRNDLIKLVDPFEVIEDFTPNLTVTSGLGVLTSCLTGTATTAFSAANKVVLGNGTSATAAAAADTNLGAQTWWQVADSIPTRTTTTVTNDTVTVVATVANANGNAVWAEWGLALATAGTLVSAATLAGTGTASLFNHKIAALGTKTSTFTWAFTVNLTWS